MMRPEASDEQEYLYLTTRGRKTGRAHQIEIWFTRRGRRYYLVAEHGLRAHWVQNLLVDIQARSKSKYGWGDGLVVELDPGPRHPRRVPRGDR